MLFHRYYSALYEVLENKFLIIIIYSIWDLGFCFAHFDLKIEKPDLERVAGDFFHDYFMKYCMLRN